ncbi:hypothetical protein SNE40_014608 [Patella caerulea]|uniref:Uncharacterized protein n=1 Tax=Patella caerulea TaxID=87958 RepID=A0AAN8JIJ8_PATCE
MSSSQDALFIVKNGNLKPGKHINLGMAIKSMTDSKTLVRMLNRLGHVVNYHAIEQIETTLGESIQTRKLACPEGAVIGEVIGLAFDNFDELTGTLSGADTLHDTMGILYQNKRTQTWVDLTGIRNPEPGSQTKKKFAKKRNLQVMHHPLEPYRKKNMHEDFRLRHRGCWKSARRKQIG